jgi:glycosyltransferase involved in cell wall biosynthesis
MKQPLVSVLMNCYNGETHLRKAIESVLAQTYENWELIFWDNQSTDSSRAIVQSYHDPRIRYFLAPSHTSFSHARILASNQIKGEWIAVLDSDDYWLVNNLNTKLGIGDIEPDVGLIYSRCIIDRSRIQRNSSVHPRSLTLPQGRIFQHLLRANFIPGHTTLYRTRLFQSVGGFDDYLICEYLLALKIAKVAKVCAQDCITAVYRQHDLNLSFANESDIFSERRKLVELFPEIDVRRQTNGSIHYDLIRLAWSKKCWTSEMFWSLETLSPSFIAYLIGELAGRASYKFSGLQKKHNTAVQILFSEQ